MKHIHFAAPLLALALASLGSCEEEESISGLVDDVIVEVNEQVGVACDCFEELGYQSRGACEDGLGFVGPSRERCVKDAYADDEASSRQYLDCILPLEQEYSTCVNSRFVCDDLTASQPCLDDYDVGKRNCINLPANVERDLQACFPDEGQ